MATKKQPEPAPEFKTKLGPIPQEKWANDIPVGPVDKSPGSVYDHVMQKIKKPAPPKK